MLATFLVVPATLFPWLFNDVIIPAGWLNEMKLSNERITPSYAYIVANIRNINLLYVHRFFHEIYHMCNM